MNPDHIWIAVTLSTACACLMMLIVDLITETKP